MLSKVDQITIGGQLKEWRFAGTSSKQEYLWADAIAAASIVPCEGMWSLAHIQAACPCKKKFLDVTQTLESKDLGVETQVSRSRGKHLGSELQDKYKARFNGKVMENIHTYLFT